MAALTLHEALALRSDSSVGGTTSMQTMQFHTIGMLVSQRAQLADLGGRASAPKPTS